MRAAAHRWVPWLWVKTEVPITPEKIRVNHWLIHVNPIYFGPQKLGSHETIAWWVDNFDP